MRLSLPLLGASTGGTDVHSCNLCDWGQRRGHLHTAAGVGGTFISEDLDSRGEPTCVHVTTYGEGRVFNLCDKAEDEVLQRAS